MGDKSLFVRPGHIFKEILSVLLSIRSPFNLASCHLNGKPSIMPLHKKKVNILLPHMFYSEGHGTYFLKLNI